MTAIAASTPGVDASGPFGDGRPHVASSSFVAPAPAQPAATAAPGVTPTPSIGREQAAQEIARLRSGADPAWLKAFSMQNDPGHRAAIDRMSQLHQAAEGEVGQEAQQGGDVQSWPLQFEPNATPAAIVEAQRTVSEAVQSMQVDPELARGMIGQMERAIVSRGGKPMDAIELARLDFTMQSRWGDQHAAKMASAQRALMAAGKSAAWLQSSILKSDPITAALVLESLASHGARLAQRS